MSRHLSCSGLFKISAEFFLLAFMAFTLKIKDSVPSVLEAGCP